VSDVAQILARIENGVGSATAELLPLVYLAITPLGRGEDSVTIDPALHDHRLTSQGRGLD